MPTSRLESLLKDHLGAAIEEAEIDAEDDKASAMSGQLCAKGRPQLTAIFVTRHILEAICGRLLITVGVVERYCRDLATSPYYQRAYGCKDDPDEKERRQDGFRREYRLPSLQTLLLECRV